METKDASSLPYNIYSFHALNGTQSCLQSGNPINDHAQFQNRIQERVL